MTDLLGLVALLMFAVTCLVVYYGDRLLDRLDNLKGEVEVLQSALFSEGHQGEFRTSVAGRMEEVLRAVNDHAGELLKETKAIRDEIDPASWLRSG